MSNIEITKFNTFKCYMFGEIEIDKFMNTLERKTKKYYADYTDKLSVVVKQEIEVYADEEYSNKYYIYVNKGSRVIPDASYSINTTNYPNLAKRLDNLCELTKKYLYEKECYKKAEENANITTEENIVYLNYLKKAKNGFRKYYRFNAYILMALIFLGLSITTLNLYNFLLTFSIVIATQASAGAAIAFYSLNNLCFEDLKNMFRVNKLLNKRIKRMKKILEKSNDKGKNLNNNDIQNINNRDIYHDNIINYMNSVMQVSKELKPEDRKEKLLELRIILNEYITRNINLDEQSSGLSFENKKAISLDIINKLARLEIEIADMLNQKNKTESLVSDSEKLMQELNKNINVINDEIGYEKSGGRSQTLTLKL